MYLAPKEICGLLYPTAAVQRCGLFTPCQRCRQCSAYDNTKQSCCYCEQQKLEKDRCRHTIAQKEISNTLDAWFKRPMWSTDYAPQTMNVQGVLNDDNRMNATLEAMKEDVLLQEDVEEETLHWGGKGLE